MVMSASCRRRYAATFVPRGGFAGEISRGLPEDLVRLLDSSGFEIQQLSGDFDGSTFYPDESDHLVVVAKRAPGDN